MINTQIYSRKKDDRKVEMIDRKTEIDDRKAERWIVNREMGR